jgi:hypothetical protein
MFGFGLTIGFWEETKRTPHKGCRNDCNALHVCYLAGMKLWSQLCLVLAR